MKEWSEVRSLRGLILMNTWLLFFYILPVFVPQEPARKRFEGCSAMILEHTFSSHVHTNWERYTLTENVIHNHSIGLKKNCKIALAVIFSVFNVSNVISAANVADICNLLVRFLCVCVGVESGLRPDESTHAGNWVCLCGNSLFHNYWHPTRK